MLLDSIEQDVPEDERAYGHTGGLSPGETRSAPSTWRATRPG